MTEGWHRRWGWTVAHYIRNAMALCGRQKYTGEPMGARKSDKLCKVCQKRLAKLQEVQS